jgi:hypothetical protein
MKTTRMFTAAATTVALCLSVLTASPAEAAVTRSFSESGSGSASWGTVTFNSYSWNVDAYIYRDSGDSIRLEVCGWQSLSNGSWGLLGTCKSATNGGSIGSTRHVTTLGGSASYARVSMVSTDLYINGVFVDGDWNYGF